MTVPVLTVREQCLASAYSAAAARFLAMAAMAGVKL